MKVFLASPGSHISEADSIYIAANTNLSAVVKTLAPNSISLLET